MEVHVWEEQVTIPTYGIGTPEKNPVFLEKRVYQGSSGSVYPYPVIEKIMDEKADKVWKALFLENRYLKIMILPELGGRIQMAYDKTKGRHFVYYNQVIKPALVGLTGPWISGGIEFNWPQHHRPTTYEPVDYCIEENTDGSKTVWCSEVERMFRTRGMTGFTLYRDKAYLEINVRLYNRTPHPQTFLWWANPAVHVNDEYQSVFPPDVHAVYDHGRRDVSRFPIATGTYYKVDYSAGVDISRYKNLPVPTSYMAVNSGYDFIGGYEHDTRGGMLHVADHHIAPGKKQWTWGNGDFGVAWDRNLTDEDGPYIELMCGVFTDNQPDFSWIMPYEERSFNQYFMPYRDIGIVKNATREAMVNLEFSDTHAVIGVYCTGIYTGAELCLTCKDELVLKELVDLNPEKPYEKTVDINPATKPQDYILSVLSREGRLLVSWQPEQDVLKPIPEPAKPAREPKEIASIEQLYLTGLHLEQYRHATFNAAGYYLEALKREPGDIRNNNAMGLLLLRKGLFAEAETYFRTAIKTLTEYNPNPYDGEPFFNLGLCLRYQERYDESYDAFYKSVWNAAWQDAGFLNLAQIASLKGDFSNALNLVSHGLIRNGHNHIARHLKIALLRKLSRTEEANQVICDSLAIDRFAVGIWFEKYLMAQNALKTQVLNELKALARGNIHTFIEYSLDYALAGMFEEAEILLKTGIDDPGNVYPMAYYLLGWFSVQSADEESARKYVEKAEYMDPGYCFPNRLEELLALQYAMKLNPSGARAPHYLGNFWYANRQYKRAVKCWELSEKLDENYPTVKRNLALACFNKLHDADRALQELERAFLLDTSDSRILMELDQLYKRLNKPFQKRLSLLETYPALIEYRDDLYLEVITLHNLLGNHEKALDMLMRRKFHPWEGGEGKVTAQYLFAHTEMAKKAIASTDFGKAIEHLDLTEEYPRNLGEGKLTGAQENDIFYWKGCAYEGLGDMQKARECWTIASKGLSEPSLAVYYNDQQPDSIFYQGLALLKLDRKNEARGRFNKLKDYGERHMFDSVKTDYFAVSLPDLLIWEDDLRKRHMLHCKYLIGLGNLGLGCAEEANKTFAEIIEVDCYHVGSRIHINLVNVV